MLGPHPAVMEFIVFLRSVPEADLPVVLGVISDQMFPNSDVGWFHTNNVDPLVNPTDAVPAVIQESLVLSPQVLQSPNGPVKGPWRAPAI